jgi:GNAT superfamily N-acetyltransferase
METTVRIRRATPADLEALRSIEEAADGLFADLFGPQPFGPAPAESGASRAARPGELLVALGTRASAQDQGDPVLTSPVGFVHVLHCGGEAHLEQLAVLPSHARRGIGSALIESCCRSAARRGFRRITLRTYADVPWNAPFYERRGFRVVDPIATPFGRGLVEQEQRLGLERHGRRVLMQRDLTE